MEGLCLKLALAVALMTAAAPARAEDDELKAKAQQLLTQGNELAADGDFGLALDKFRAAYELFPSPKLLLNIGTSLRQIGNNAEAHETYQRYLAHPEADPARRRELEGILRELDALVGRIAIVVEEGGVRVSLDGKVLRDIRSGDVFRVDPGDHTVVAEKLGRPPTVRHVAVKARRTVEVELTLELTAPEPSGPDVRVVIGVGLAGLGGAATVAGAILGGVALSTKSDAEELCSDGGEFSGYCSDEGADRLASAQTLGVASTALFIGGAALVVSGLALAFSAPSADEPGLALVVAPGGGALRVRW